MTALPDCFDEMIVYRVAPYDGHGACQVVDVVAETEFGIVLPEPLSQGLRCVETASAWLLSPVAAPPEFLGVRRWTLMNLVEVRNAPDFCPAKALNPHAFVDVALPPSVAIDEAICAADSMTFMFSKKNSQSEYFKIADIEFIMHGSPRSDLRCMAFTTEGAVHLQCPEQFFADAVSPQLEERP